MSQTLRPSCIDYRVLLRLPELVHIFKYRQMCIYERIHSSATLFEVMVDTGVNVELILYSLPLRIHGSPKESICEREISYSVQKPTCMRNKEFFLCKIRFFGIFIRCTYKKSKVYIQYNTNLQEMKAYLF